MARIDSMSIRALKSWRPPTRDKKKRQDKFFFDLETEDSIENNQWWYDKSSGCWVINLSKGQTVQWQE
jgi:hypothetical protein